MITSRDNPLVRHARRARDGKETSLIFIEGVRLCEEAARGELKIESVLHTPRFAASESEARDDRHARLLESLTRAASQVASVNETVFASLSGTKSPQGIVALARRPPTDAETFARRVSRGSPLVLVLHRINNPSNAGAVLRAAEAAGSDGVIVTEHSTDLFSPKALRGAMGSSFRLPLWTGAQVEEVIAWCAARNIHTVCADARAAQDYAEYDWRRACALVVGAEASGLTEEETEATDGRVKIPMSAPVESLNVAVAAAVILFEAARQRAQEL